MKRHIRQTILLLPLLILWACQKEKVSDSSFEVTMTYVRAHSAMYDIIPATNDYYYVCGAVSVADYNRMGDTGVADSLNAFYKEIYEIVREIYTEYLDTKPPSFREMLENGAIYGTEYGLLPETGYYLCVMCYNRHNRPIKTIVKAPFVTKDTLASSVTFDVKTAGTQVVITPSNEEQYYWDIAQKEAIDTRYYGMPDYYYSETVETYERYGFIQTMLTRGADTLDLQYLSLHPQDTLYVMAAGYYNETNSQTAVYELVYQWDNTFTVAEYSLPEDGNAATGTEQAARRWLLRKNAVLPGFKR